MPALHDIFEIWGSLADMARDLDVPYQTVAKWSQRGRIPYEAWAGIISAAKLKDRELTHADLAAANPPRQSAHAP